MTSQPQQADRWAARVRSVTDVLVSPLRSDGAHVVISRVTPASSEIVIGYDEGSCGRCAMAPRDLARLVEEAVWSAVGSQVRVIVETPAGPASPVDA